MGTMTERAQAPARPRRNIAPAPGSYHPANRPRLPRRWWEFNRHYTLYMLRELSSVFIALWSALFLVQLGRLRHGKESYERFVAAQRRPAWVLFNLIAFLFSLLHSVTWLQLTGIVQPIRIGRRKVDPRVVTAAAFGGWAVASLGVALILLLGGRNDRA